MIKRKSVLIFFAASTISAVFLNCFAGKITDSLKNDFFNKAYAADDDSICNIKYITDNEKKNVTEIEDKLDSQGQAVMPVKSLQVSAESENINYKEYFNDTVFVGDSITEYISAAQMLPESNVFAEKGKTVIKSAAEDVDRLKYSNPKRIIMLFGMNDVVNFSNSQDYKDKYIELVNKIKESVPKAEIYIESPTPIRSDAEKTQTGFTNKRLDEFRKTAQEVAEETNVKYIDITKIITNDDYFEVDGIHFKRNFYDALFSYLPKVLDSKENN